MADLSKIKLNGTEYDLKDAVARMLANTQADWNQNDETQPDFVKNRPFYTVNPVETVLVEKSTVKFEDDDGMYMGQLESTFSPTVGETYKVSWDGTTYEITCVNIEGQAIIGNLSIAGEGSDTGEPFVMGVDNGLLVIGTADTASSHTFSISGFAQEVVKIDPKYLPIPFKPKGKSYLTFSSPNEFTLAKSRPYGGWDGTLEYFASDETWTTWNGADTLSAVYNGGEYVLYLRGVGNSVITGGSSWHLVGIDIKCIGNIENLLDYATVESGNHPIMGVDCYRDMFSSCIGLTQAPDLPATTLAKGCYSFMFSYCKSLTQAPDLPATTLADDCYSFMFSYCKSLTQAPDLPATTLAKGCYRNMFEMCDSLTQAPDLPATTLADDCYSFMFFYCKSLTQVPDLPATTLAYQCYFSMFRGCSSLKLSFTKTDEYIQEYRIPSSGNGVMAMDALARMFEDTGGALTVEPSINTTYYLSSDNRVIRETDIATLNGYVNSVVDAVARNNLPLIITASCSFTSSLTSGVDTPLEVTNVSKTYADIAEAVSNNRPIKMIVSNGNLKVNLDLTAFDGNTYYFTNSYDPFTMMGDWDNESFNITVKASQAGDNDVFTWMITYNKNVFAKKSEVQTQINEAIGGITEFDTQVVQSLPQTGVEGTIYFTPNNHGANDAYDEFIYVNNAWEKIGNTQVDLSGYVRTNDLALVATSGDYNNLNNTPDIPEKTSDLTNDSGFITLADIPVELPVVSSTDNDKVLTVDNGVWTAKTPAIQFSGDYNDLMNKPTLFDGDYNSLSNKPTLFSGDYEDLSNKPTIPSATVVTQTITSGIKIAEINGTAIYAPAYANGDQIAY